MTCTFSEISTIPSGNCFGIRTQVWLIRSPCPATEICVCDLLRIRGGRAGAPQPAPGPFPAHSQLC